MHLVQTVKAACIADLQRHMQRLAEVRQELQCVYADLDMNVLKRAQVIGMTTNGVASKQELVAAIGPKVLSARMYCADIIGNFMQSMMNQLQGWYVCQIY